MLAFQNTEKGVELLCGKPLVINGVSVRSRILKAGDRILIGPLRLFFNSVENLETLETPGKPEALPSPGLSFIKADFGRLLQKKHLLPAALVTAVLASAVTIGCIAIPRIIKTDEIRTEAESPADHRGVPEALAPETYEQQADSAELQAWQRSDKLIVVPPGGEVPEFDLDILFIHAHPDDEALDFGILMALADSAGLKTGLITFTDGGSGLDIYPGRPVADPYPDYRMEGDELADIRAGELVRAAEVLGIDLVIRLGLKNHPYNRLKDELSPDEVLEIWGGREALADLLLEIIDKTSPETVAAPDVPGPAREHFEHEAVGSLAAEVMTRMRADVSDSPPVRFITCVDPRQNLLYPEASLVDAGLKVGLKEGDVSLRDVQLRALAMHKTQNDAVNVGTGFLPAFPAEYYQIQYRQATIEPDEWIAFFGSPEPEINGRL